MFDIDRMLMNCRLRFILSIFFIEYFITAQECTGLYLLQMLVNLSQHRESVRIFNNSNLSVQSEVSGFKVSRLSFIIAYFNICLQC